MFFIFCSDLYIVNKSSRITSAMRINTHPCCEVCLAHVVAMVLYIMRILEQFHAIFASTII